MAKVNDNSAAVGRLFNQIRDQRDEAQARATAAEAEVERLRTELADVLEVALVRGNWFGYSDDAYLDRWENATDGF